MIRQRLNNEVPIDDVEKDHSESHITVSKHEKKDVTRFTKFLSIIVAFFLGRMSSSEMPLPTQEKVMQYPERPLQLFSLLKDFNTGTVNMKVPDILLKNATGAGVLIVDIGLDEGKEFFTSIKSGYEVVGIEANPKLFEDLSLHCTQIPTCNVIDLDQTSLPLQREAGQSYLINIGAGEKEETLEFHLHGPVSSFTNNKGLSRAEKKLVKVVRLDDIIREDIFLLKIDTQGYDFFVLKGSQKIFQKHTVRQVMIENDPFNLGCNNVTTHDVVELAQSYGLACFSARKESDLLPVCRYVGESVEGYEKVFYPRPTYSNKFGYCWDDFICINVEKAYQGGFPNE